MIEHIISALFSSTSQIVKIHLGDISLDPSSLIGGYVSSSKNPGTFEWKEGVLVTAMREAKVLILEDIDKASSEVLGTLWPLVESLSMVKSIGADASLRVSGRGIVRAAQGFTLFATVTTSNHTAEGAPPLTFLGAHKWDRVNILPPSKGEVETIVNTSFPRLNNNVVKVTLRAWDQLCDLAGKESLVSRQLITRDLMRWCARIDALVGGSLSSTEDTMDIDEASHISFSDILQNPVLREEMFLEARDVFLGAYPTNNTAAIKQMKNIALLLANQFSISEDRLQSLLEKHTPQIQFIKNREGRVSNVILDSINLPTLHHSGPTTSSARPFALHRQSLTLLTSIARSVQLNEPVLLTGETGTGKTTLITYLASILSQKLVSLNLSHQTDSSDMLGGFKPVEATDPAQRLQERFAALFSATFSREKNLKFEEAVRVALTGKKWKRAVLLWREATGKAQDRIQQKNKNDQPERLVALSTNQLIPLFLTTFP